MWTGLLWFALLAAAGLCYPRRPRTAGALWIALGALTLSMNVPQNPDWVALLSGLFTIGLQRNPNGGFALLSSLFMIGLGTWYLVKYRNSDVRAKHVEYWTAKA